jgi:molybdopterin synthase catalytic subunit
MQIELVLSEDAINESELNRAREKRMDSGAVISFLGVVRDSEDDQGIEALEYECYPDMARRQFELIFELVSERWKIMSLRLTHRTGVVAVGEPSLWVEVVAGHRKEAFEACQFLIDRMKEKVPIWKKPIYKQ